jgi:hypothetical protein
MTLITLRPLLDHPLRSFDPSATGFVSRLKAQDLRGVWTAPEVWEEYAFFFAECAGPNERPLTHSQLFRQLRSAGMRRFRAGAKDPGGKRPYLYRIASPGRPSKRRGRCGDARPCSVAERAF